MLVEVEVASCKCQTVAYIRPRAGPRPNPEEGCQNLGYWLITKTGFVTDEYGALTER